MWPTARRWTSNEVGEKKVISSTLVIGQDNTLSGAVGMELSFLLLLFFSPQTVWVNVNSTSAYSSLSGSCRRLWLGIVGQKTPFVSYRSKHLHHSWKHWSEKKLGNIRLHHVYRCVFGGTQHAFPSPNSSHLHFLSNLCLTREPSASLERIQFLNRLKRPKPKRLTPERERKIKTQKERSQMNKVNSRIKYQTSVLDLEAL